MFGASSHNSAQLSAGSAKRPESGSSSQPRADRGVKRQNSQSTSLRYFADSAIVRSHLQQVEHVIPRSITDARLVYSLSKHGASSSAFHQRCDGLAPCIVFAKVSENVFGYYMNAPFS